MAKMKKVADKKDFFIDKFKNGAFLELDGAVYLIERKNGKEIFREQLDSQAVLDAFLSTLHAGLDSFVKKK
jgi:hypothetical protein